MIKLKDLVININNIKYKLCEHPNGSDVPEEGFYIVSAISGQRYILKEREDIIISTERKTLPWYLHSIHTLDLTQRSANCLIAEDIHIIGELCSWNESTLLKTPNFGKKSLREVETMIDIRHQATLNFKFTEEEKQKISKYNSYLKSLYNPNDFFDTSKDHLKVKYLKIKFEDELPEV